MGMVITCIGKNSGLVVCRRRGRGTKVRWEKSSTTRGKTAFTHSLDPVDQTLEERTFNVAGDKCRRATGRPKLLRTPVECISGTRVRTAYVFSSFFSSFRKRQSVP